MKTGGELFPPVRLYRSFQFIRLSKSCLTGGELFVLIVTPAGKGSVAKLSTPHFSSSMIRELVIPGLAKITINLTGSRVAELGAIV